MHLSADLVNLTMSGNLLGAKHAAERMQRCWAHPSGQAFSIKHLRESFKVHLATSALPAFSL